MESGEPSPFKSELGVKDLMLGYNAEAVKILIFAAEGLTKRSAVGFLLRSLIMFQTFISSHNLKFFSDYLFLTFIFTSSSALIFLLYSSYFVKYYFTFLMICLCLLHNNLIIFHTFISRHYSIFFSDKLVLTSFTPASSAPVLQTPKATSSTLYFDSLTVNAGNGGFLHCIQMDTSVNAANQVVSV